MVTSGDQHSHFFHLTAIIRRQRNSILKIRDEHGSWISEAADIAKVFTYYYTNLFTASQPRSIEEVLNHLDCRIDDNMNVKLLLPITKEEVRMAAFSLGSSKAPGLDEFSGGFHSRPINS